MVVLSLGLIHFLTWEMVRKQSFGGVIWFGFVWYTGEATETHTKRNRNRGILIQSKWDAQKHTKWGPTSDTLKREASRHDPGGRVTMGQSMSSVLTSRTALVGHEQTIYQLSTSGCDYGRKRTSPTYFRWSLIVHVWLQTFSMCIPKRNWAQSSVPQLTKWALLVLPNGMP